MNKLVKHIDCCNILSKAAGKGDKGNNKNVLVSYFAYKLIAIQRREICIEK